MNTKKQTDQRTMYNLVKKITLRSYTSELKLLSSLVKDIVQSEKSDIFGGRVWELDSTNHSYKLKYQYGKIKKIPSDYTISIDDHFQVLSQLYRKKTILSSETDSLLREKGIDFYSVSGISDLVKLKGSLFYKYIVGFNAPEIQSSFTETLNIISNVATIAIRNMNNAAAKSKIQKDIVKASEIQRYLLPEHDLQFNDYEIYGLCIPDSEVGGDYYDFIHYNTDEYNSLGMVICDAASKGLPAAIQALFVSGALRMGTAFSTKIATLLNRLNTLIFDTFPYERLVTLFYCDLTMSSNRMVAYANAGHCPPVHYSPAKDRFEFLDNTGGILGLMQQQKYGVENIIMREGDILLLYTDGITESQDDKGNFFGEEQLCETLKTYQNESSKTIALKIIELNEKFSSKSAYNDDKTIIVIKRNVIKTGNGE